MIIPKRWILYYLPIFLIALAFYKSSFWQGSLHGYRTYQFSLQDTGSFQWDTLPQQYPVSSFISLPSGRPKDLPRIQHEFSDIPDAQVEAKRIERLARVRANFEHAWNGYKTYAWAKDEAAPLSGASYNTFGGWAATLVDSLDSLWIMGFKDDFEMAVAEVAKLDFTTSVHEELNVFETTIRYIGGFLAAYDLSGNEILLCKAVELGNMMYVAFDTPNRMPITRWNWQEAYNGSAQEADDFVISAEVGSLLLEFTRLSQLTGDPKFFDAIQRITREFQKQQDQTKLPGMWPVIINPKYTVFTGGQDYGLGAMADSLYEYLPKEFMLLGGHHPEYQEMYEKVIARAKESLFFRPLNKDNLDILLSGTALIDEHGNVELDPQGQHLACFAGGMVAISARLFRTPSELLIAQKLVEGCIWAYTNTATNLMPETFHAIPCSSPGCEWNESLWAQAALARVGDKPFHGSAQSLIEQTRLTPGFADIPDRRYVLRPEAIEAIFMLYRVTGDEALREKAWGMFEAVEKHTRTDIAHAVVDDVTVLDAPKGDRMETFWTAETLKYYYLLYARSEVMSLDEWVFNTEAHPFRRPK